MGLFCISPSNDCLKGIVHRHLAQHLGGRPRLLEKAVCFAYIQYPARTYPCQRFSAARADDSA
jgi:hypothetical protein